MKMLISTAMVLLKELNEKVAAANEGDNVIELSQVAAALLNDAEARNELDQYIDDASSN